MYPLMALTPPSNTSLPRCRRPAHPFGLRQTCIFGEGGRRRKTASSFLAGSHANLNIQSLCVRHQRSRIARRVRRIAAADHKRRSVPASNPSPLLATPRKTSQPRPYATRAWRTPTVEARPANPIACAMCGEPVLKRRRRHCEACMPKARRELPVIARLLRWN
jgi:hypothetical protein